ncbi:MAG TPA: G1 family glutamic endopeptidase [Gaiellaceae bacterium]|jgi:hypothetical protein
MFAGRRIAVALAVLVFTGASAGTAAAGIHHDLSLSLNWAGYAVNGTNATTGAPASFSVISGSWTVPKVDCSQGAATWSSVWVGLGGDTRGSTAVEQVGTDADCIGLTPNYFAWYELVPAPSVPTRLKVFAGDQMTGLVIVKGTRVGFRLRDVTRGTTLTKYVSAFVVDLTSAEWVVEAPSQCDSFTCHVLPLSNFGSIAVTGGAAVGDGHAGTIADIAWAATPIELLTEDPATRLPTGIGAVPSELGADGGSFTVAYSTNLSLPTS